MDKYLIKGGKKLSGKVRVSSAKNSVLPLIAGSILTDEKVVIKECPKILDVLNMIKIIESIGAKTQFDGEDLIIDASGVNNYIVKQALAKELRSSVFMLGSLISRFRRAEIYYPGGCEIGLRPIDIHISSLRLLGVLIDEDGCAVRCDANLMKAGEVYLDFPSVGATENLILASVFVKGETVIRNAAKEPEIIDLIRFLNGMGAKITGGGTDIVKISGVKKLHGTVYKPLSDRIETGTLLVAVAISGGEVEISNINPENISSLIYKLCNNTCKISLNNDIIYIKGGKVRKCFSVETNPYPGFPTDMQAQMTALATVSKGTSLITENVFEMRFKFVKELIKMGADIKLCGRTAIVKGVKRLHGAVVRAHDLRGGAALVLAGLNAEGETVVEDTRHIERGYANFDAKLLSLGADIKKI